MTAQRPTLNGIGMVYKGDKTSHGGVVLTGFDRSTWNGIPQARLGDQVFCPKCKPHKHIISSVSGMNVHGVESALHGDLVSCGATLVAEGADPPALAWASAFLKGDAYDEQFLLQDVRGEPLSNIPYTAKYSDGREYHGQTDEAGYTDRIFTRQGEKIEIRVGHQVKDGAHE